MRDIVENVAAWMDDRANNAIEPGSDLPAFDTPLLGCASGADPLFERIKADIGPEFYWTPLDAYRLAFPEEAPAPEELRVISWVLPQTAHTRAAHRKAGPMPSIEWSRARHFGEMVNRGLRLFMVELLESRGVNAVAPVMLPTWGRAMSRRYGFASMWSERHTAHVCGLGTFGHCDGLITPVGKAVRLGSVVARMEMETTPRPYSKHNEWCLRVSKGVCKACIKRCPAGAISESGHDKVKCKDYIRGVTGPFVESDQLGFRVNSCGLCQAGTPCESRNPSAPKEKKLEEVG
ncbi:4Fe-4S ferredoxin [Fundidesulfovibrio agrisoli]|uniref:4Fe-4S ferredoxin n=1 Tax=Fundidesulfovibrio agrisoli TaxID=2922717 RepID=UPI001FAC0960|nr:4Fe-4S ferredoxin [Fundidesulfovibrio agrisoli]